LETRAAAAGKGTKAVPIASTMAIMHVDRAAAKRDEPLP
jgi:adenylate kinase family enzyme